MDVDEDDNDDDKMISCLGKSYTSNNFHVARKAQGVTAAIGRQDGAEFDDGTAKFR